MRIELNDSCAEFSKEQDSFRDEQAAAMTRYQEPEILTTLTPETVAKRQLPVNLNQDHLALFNGELQRAIPRSHLLKFKNIRVSSEGLLFKGTRILPESFAFPNHLDQWKLRSVVKFFSKNYVLRRRRTIDKDVLWITDYWSQGYFHWLADALTRLYSVRDRVSGLLLLLPSGYEAFDYVNESLKAFNLRNVEFIRANEVIECRRLLMPGHTAPSGHYNEEMIRGVRDVLLAAHGAQDPDRRIYLSRRLASRRRLVNEDEIGNTLSGFGFETICAETLSFREQVRLCSSARCIVSNHGAGLTNILFMPQGGNVLELRHQRDRISNCYFTLASALNLNYFYQTCRPESADPPPHTADLVVDPDELEKNLHRLVSA